MVREWARWVCRLVQQFPIMSNSIKTYRSNQHERSRTESNGNERDEHQREESQHDEAHEGVKTCPECNGRLESDHEHGEIVCVECGLVVDEDSIDHGPEWRAFNSSERDNKSRVGAPTTKMMHDKGLSTNIGWQNTDGYGNTLSASQRQKMQRLRTWDERFRTRNHKERNLKQALAEIERMGSALGLGDDVRETASVIYRRALAENLLPGRSIEGVATSAVYAAARQMGKPRSLDEVQRVTRVDEMEFKRTYRYIVRELNLAIAPANPQDFVARIVSDVEGSDETERTARKLLRNAEGTGAFNGKSPVGLAAAAVYAAGRLTGEQLTQSAISHVADVSEVTIRNRYQELLDVDGATTTAGDTNADAAASA